MDNETFILTEDHVKLLRRANVRWWECETGAPAICPKRPYGNGAVAADIAEILGMEWKRDEYDDYMPQEVRERLLNLHAETETALQVVLAAGSFTPGLYVSRKYHRDWKLAE